MSRVVYIALAMILACVLVPRAEAATDYTRAALDDALDAGSDGHALIVVEALLNDEPDDANLRFERGRIRFRLGDHAGAERDYDRLARDYPDNVDYVFGLAQALAAQGDDRPALAALGRAIQLAPDYEDVWRLEHRLLVRQPDPANATRLKELREAAAQRFPRKTWYLDDVDRSSQRWEMQVGFSHDELSGDRPDWASRFASVTRMTAGDDRYTLRIRNEERFERTDRQWGVGADWRIGTDWTVGLAASFATDADFAADRQYSAHAGRPLGSSWNLDVAVRRRDFPGAVADSYTVLTEKYVGDFRVAGSVSMTHLRSVGNSLGYSLHFNWYPRPPLSLGIVATTGAEAEAVGAGQVLETDVAGVALTGRYRFLRRWSIDVWLGTHEQGDFYRRRYAGMALSVRL